LPTDAPAPRPAAARGPVGPWTSRHAWMLFAAYAVALALIALWPTHVDAPAAPLVGWFIDRIPGLTYNRLEFAANVALFVPFGLLAALALRRSRYLVLPAAIVVTVTIEAWQSLGEGRTASLLDVVANTTGAALGILIAAFVTRPRRR
jgi:hypothetical protein